MITSRKEHILIAIKLITDAQTNELIDHQRAQEMNTPGEITAQFLKNAEHIDDAIHSLEQVK